MPEPAPNRRVLDERPGRLPARRCVRRLATSTRGTCADADARAEPVEASRFSSHAHVRGPRARHGRRLRHRRRSRGPKPAELDPVRPPCAIRNRHAAERPDHDVRRRAAERDRLPARRARDVPRDPDADPVQRRQRISAPRTSTSSSAATYKWSWTCAAPAARAAYWDAFGSREQRDGSELVEWAARSRGATATSACGAPRTWRSRRS